MLLAWVLLAGRLGVLLAGWLRRLRGLAPGRIVALGLLRAGRRVGARLHDGSPGGAVVAHEGAVVVGHGDGRGIGGYLVVVGASLDCGFHPLEAACGHHLVHPLERDGVVGVPATHGHHFLVEEQQLLELVLIVGHAAKVDDLPHKAGHDIDAARATVVVHRDDGVERGIALHIVEQGHQPLGTVGPGEVAVYHRHVAVVVAVGLHALALAVDIVGLVAVHDTHHGHKLAHPDDEVAVLTLDAVGTLKIGRGVEQALHPVAVDLPHGLALEGNVGVLEVLDDAAGRDKGLARGVHHLDVDLAAHLVACLAMGPDHPPREQRGEHNEQYVANYLQRCCFFTSSHILGKRSTISPAPTVNKISKLSKWIELSKFSLL